MKRYILLFLIVPLFLNAQHIPVLPGLTGSQLEEAIRQEYTPSTLGYSDARDTLFKNILLVNGRLACLYSDYSVPLNPNLDPSEDAFSQGINTEHIYPQSKGAEKEPARSNMYNLYPVRENINNDRGNLQFGEVDDNLTKWWYYLDKKVAAKPATNVDAYSELGNTFFEPAENRKGDIARSIFYFTTIYHAEAQQADANYLQPMLKDLCAWHIQDPVDQDEWNRNIAISVYQDNKVNPFIYDCTLPERSICSSFNIQCTPTNSTHSTDIPVEIINFYPNPAVNVDFIQMNILGQAHAYFVLDSYGRLILSGTCSTKSEEKINIYLPNPGIYYLFQKDRAGYLIGRGTVMKL